MFWKFLSLGTMLATTVVGLAADLQVGAARIDITPPVGLPMWGYGARHDKPNEGVLDPMFADAVVIAVGDARIGIVGLDLGRAPTRKSFEIIRKRVADDLKIGHLFLVGSHTHHGPVLEIAETSPKVAAYTRDLENKLVDVLKTATEKLKPARVATARAQVPFNRNRHSKMPNPPIDKDLTVVRFVDSESKTIATLVNFAAHPTSIPESQLMYSPDYPCTLKSAVRDALGGECLFLQSAAGDMSTNRTEDYRGYGKRIGNKVVEIIRDVPATDAKIPSLKTREERFRFEPLRVDLKQPLTRLLYSKAFFPELIDAFTKEYANGSQPLLTVALLNDRIGIVGVSGEFFSNHAVRLKERARLPTLLFLGYCNDYQQYFPTIEATWEGGYGADPQVAVAPIGSGEIMMNKALAYLYEIRSKYKPPAKPTK